MCTRLLIFGFAAICQGFFSPAVAQHLIADATTGEPYGMVTDGFVLRQESDVEIQFRYIRSSKMDGEVGTGWILDGATREVIWEPGELSGPSVRRRFADFSETVTLPAGAYECYFVAFPKSGQEPGEAEEVIAHIISSIFGKEWPEWLKDSGETIGLSVYGPDSLAHEPDPDNLSGPFLDNAFVTITSVPNNTLAREGFVLKGPQDIEIYAIGEITDRGSFDYGWIIDYESRDVVWKMAEPLEYAGGAVKNALRRDTVRLDAGRYEVVYVTDDSHSAVEWNSLAPFDPDFWGITLRTLSASALDLVDGFEPVFPDSADALVRLAPLGNGREVSGSFTLEGDGVVRIYALGEGGRGGLADYGWITSAATDSTVWTMRDEETESAGGANKNRMTDRLLALPEGVYHVHYRTDNSHAYRDWNDDRPYDHESWGITVWPARQAVTSRSL